jgi:hypothetical protein
MKTPTQKDDDWHPVCENETDDSINLKKEAVAKKLIDSEIPPERIKNVMDALENNLDILRAPRAGDIKYFECSLETVEGFREFHSRTKGGISEFESRILAKTIAELWNNDCIEDSMARVSSNTKLVPKPNQRIK